jgi:hypothetical protein
MTVFDAGWRLPHRRACHARSESWRLDRACGTDFHHGSRQPVRTKRNAKSADDDSQDVGRSGDGDAGTAAGHRQCVAGPRVRRVLLPHSSPADLQNVSGLSPRPRAFRVLRAVEGRRARDPHLRFLENHGHRRVYPHRGNRLRRTDRLRHRRFAGTVSRRILLHDSWHSRRRRRHGSIRQICRPREKQGGGRGAGLRHVSHA